MGLVDDDHADARGDDVEDGRLELGVGEAFGRDEEDVDLVRFDAVGDAAPVILIGGVDRLGVDAHARRGVDLVSHEGEERRDEEGGAEAGLTQELGGDEVDETLAPPGLLDDEEAPVAVDEVADGVPLTVAEGGVGVAGAGTEEVEGAAVGAVF